MLLPRTPVIAPWPQFDLVERPDTLAERTYQQLKRSLISGAFVPGQKITIRTVAAALGVSLTPAREAFARLIAERALELGRNRTVFVPAFDTNRLAQLYKIRIALEGMAAEAAVAAFDDLRIEALTQCQVQLVAALDRKDFRKVLAQNEEFHFAIYRAAGMPLLEQVIESLWVQVGPVLNLLYPEYSHNRKGVQHHMEAIEALRAHDAQALRAAIVADLTDGSRYLMREVEKREATVRSLSG